MYFPLKTRAFTLIELLVVLAIIALLSSVVLAALTTARAKARDGRRLQDLSMISKAVGVYEAGVATPSYGTVKTVYVSLPDSSATCGSWNLPALQSGWSYACVAGAALKNTDGTGWLPVNLSAAPGGSLLTKLPVDPINNNIDYYEYIPPQTPGTGASYLVAAAKAEVPTAAMDMNSTGGFSVGSFTQLAQATGATSTTSGGGGGALCTTSWNGWMWIPAAGCVSGLTVGTSADISGLPAAPGAIAFDGTNMWVTHSSTNSVSKITPSGTIATYSGVGGTPVAIAFDGTNMWTANQSGSVTKITPTGAMTTYWGVGTTPEAIAFDGVNMWVVNYGDSSVTKVTPAGGLTNYTGTLNYPMSIAFDGTNMWAANNGNSSATKITSSGGMTTYSSTGNSPGGIAFDGTNMWITNSGSVGPSFITKTTPAGVMTSYTAAYSNPKSIAFDGINMWAATDHSGLYVTKTSLAGANTFVYSTSGAATGNAALEGIAFDGTYMWVSNPNNSTVTKIVAR